MNELSVAAACSVQNPSVFFKTLEHIAHLHFTNSMRNLPQHRRRRHDLAQPAAFAFAVHPNHDEVRGLAALLKHLKIPRADYWLQHGRRSGDAMCDPPSGQSAKGSHHLLHVPQ
jgi:hypothetical protein